MQNSEQCKDLSGEILQYLEQVDSSFKEKLDDLGFVQKLSNAPMLGLTVLRPSQSLLKHILSLDDSEAIAVIDKMLLVENFTSLADIMQNREYASTCARTALPIKQMNNASIVLTNNATITADPQYTPRADFTVYILSDVVPDSDLKFKTRTAKSNVKTGGAELHVERYMLFESVIENTEKDKKESAMELLIELYEWAKTVNMDLADAIGSNCGYDAITSLCIILQPYKRVPTYLTNNDIADFISHVYGVSWFRSATSLYTTYADPAEKYEEIRKTYATQALAVQNYLVTVSKGLTKVNVGTKIKEIIAHVRSGAIPNLPAMRLQQDVELLYAEAELRLMAGVTFEAELTPGSNIKLLYKNKTLDRTTLFDKPLSSNIAVSISCLFTVPKSDACFFMPGIDGQLLYNIVSSGFISIDKSLKDRRAAFRENSNKVTNAVVERFTKRR